MAASGGWAALTSCNCTRPPRRCCARPTWRAPGSMPRGLASRPSAPASAMWNRPGWPLPMGRMLYENRELSKADAFGFILEKRFEGVILSGTKSAEHLEENWRAFGEALGRREGGREEYGHR